VPHSDAVAAVTEKLPSDYTAELSFRRIPEGWSFSGAEPGDIIKLNDGNFEQPHLISSSVRSVALKIDEAAAQLMATVRKMPSGERRQGILREVRRLRSRMHALLRSATESGQ